MHDHFAVLLNVLTEELADKDKWLWLTEGNLKRETETLILAVQEQALRTNLLKAKNR